LLNLTQANIQQLIDILQSNADINACLLNCSNQGVCKLNTQTLKYFCECSQYFIGTSCQTDERPCSQSNKCLNNGTCINSLDLTSFTCQCPQNGPFYGQYCENTINLCENVTCSLHGYCLQSQNKTKCQCLNGYEGEQCELESNTIKVVKNVQWTTTIICIICIVTFIILILGNDFFNFLKAGQKNRLKDTEKKSQFLEEKFYYVP
jgi:hypothetical protein